MRRFAHATSPGRGGEGVGRPRGGRRGRGAVGNSLGGVTGVGELDGELAGKLDALHAELDRLGRVVVAFSGGADSALLAAVAHRRLGPGALAVTAVSPSLAGSEAEDCRALAGEWGLAWTAVTTQEMERAAYRRNDLDRCGHCKSELMAVLAPLADGRGATVVLGVNLDDLTDHRPGQEAARAAGAEFPLVVAGFTKRDVRAVSRHLGLRTWDKPAMACLASRIPYGTEVSVSLLGQVERAERAVRALGFPDLRVRHHGDLARVEVPVARFADAIARHDQLVGAVSAAGYHFVTLDLAGLRSGSFNPAGSAHQAGHDVDHHAHDDRPEQVRQQGMMGDHPAHLGG